MTKAILALLLLPALASADPRHTLVLRSEGNADATTRGKVDVQVQRLAKTLDGNVEIGEITFTDAAAAVGCSGSEAQCRDEVLGMMGVDELISTSVASLPSGDTRILVHRMGKGTPTKDATVTVPAGGSFDAKVQSDVGPIFGVKAKPQPIVTPPTITNTNTPPANTISTGTPPPAFGEPAKLTPAEPPPQQGNPTTQPNGAVPLAEGRNSRAVTGLAIGGGLVVLSIILWAEAGSVQGDINNAPTTTPADFQHLKDLEAKGDAYSGLGNLTFLGGLVVGGISGYFFYKDHRSHSGQAAIVPTINDHGAGIAFTYGGL